MYPTAILCLTFLMLMCSPRLSAAESDAESGVREADTSWANAIAMKLLELTVACYDPEAVTAGSAMFPARGPEAFRKQWRSLFAQLDFALSWELKKVVVMESGNIAYTAGTWTGSSPAEFGPYLAVWRKQQDGKWKVLVDAAWFCKK